MKHVIISITLLISNLNVFGQTWTAGPKIAFGLNTAIRGNELRVGANSVDLEARLSSSPTLFGGFVRYDRPRWYGQAEGLYGKAETSLVRSSASLGSSGGDFLTGKRTDVRVLAGVKPLPWLRLYAGGGYARLNWTIQDYDREIALYRREAQESPTLSQDRLARADFAQFSKVVDQSYRPNILMGQAGFGIDVQGFMIDLTYSQSLTPLIDGVTVNNQTYAARQHYRNLALSIAYQLLPTKSFLTASRQNRAYERIKRDIPFYRNEFHASVGLLGDDIGSAFIYENRYTRYLTRRFGLTTSLNLMRVYETFDTGFLPKQYTQVQLVTGLRVLPLYSRRHTIGLSVGPMLVYRTGFRVYSGGSSIVNGKPFQTVNFGEISRANQLTVDVQGTIDYHFAATDRLIVGPWLRATPDYGYLGVQAGYRF